MDNNIITVSGDPGSGKTSTIKVLNRIFEQEKKKVKVYSTGAIFRKLAEEKGMTVTEFNQFLEKQKCDTDAEIDNAIKRLGKKIIKQKDKSVIYIIDSRLAWYNIPQSFKVRLTVADEIAGERIFSDKTRGEEDRYNTLEDAINETRERKQSERERYLELYGDKADISDPSNFDINIDTSLVTPEEVAECIIKCREKMKSEDYIPNRWASPKRFLPTQRIIDINTMNLDKISDSMKKLGYDSNKSINAVQVDGRTFVVHGHHRCIAASKSDIPLIPYEIIGKDDEQYIYTKQTVREYINEYFKDYYPTMLYDYEEILSGNYTKLYPGIYAINDIINGDGENR